MKGRTWVFIIAAVAAAHLAVFLLLARTQVLPERRFIPPANFHVRETRTLDEATGDTYVYREISVSTKLKPRAPQPEASVTPTFTP